MARASIKFSLLFLLLVNVFKAQDSTRSFVLKTEVFFPVYQLIYDDIALSITPELCFKKHHSVQLSGLYSNIASTTGSRKFTSLQAILAYKYFLGSKKPHTGLYIGAYCKLNSLTSTYDYKGFSEPFYLKYRTVFLGGGAVMGYQNYIFKRLVVDLFLGVGVRESIDTKIIEMKYTDAIPASNTLFDAVIAINIGYKF